LKAQNLRDALQESRIRGVPCLNEAQIDWNQQPRDWCHASIKHENQTHSHQ
jgi:hypothetical protein